MAYRLERNRALLLTNTPVSHSPFLTATGDLPSVKIPRQCLSPRRNSDNYHSGSAWSLNEKVVRLDKSHCPSPSTWRMTLHHKMYKSCCLAHFRHNNFWRACALHSQIQAMAIASSFTQHSNTCIAKTQHRPTQQSFQKRSRFQALHLSRQSDAAISSFTGHIHKLFVGMRESTRSLSHSKPDRPTNVG